MKERLKRILFRAILFSIVLVSLEAVGYLGMWLNSRSSDVLSNKNYFRIRGMLTGGDPEHLPRYLSSPYLGYIPYPSYKRNGFMQHNEDGYRGARIPLFKTDKLRVLCLGGSTTYGFGVEDPSLAYPAQLQKMLDAAILSDSTLDGYTGAEVINAGLEAGNSAEELQQYLFKYRYYQPDVVVVHSGINDALLCSEADSSFQLDYTHYRRINFHLEPLANPARTFMRSYLFSYLAIRFFYHGFSDNHADEFQHQGKQTFAHWSNLSPQKIIQDKDMHHYPFYNNSKALYEQVVDDGAILLFLPNVLNRNSEMVRSNKMYREFAAFNDSLSRSLVTALGGTYVNLSFDSIRKAESWLDDCHLDAEGERDKASIVSVSIVSAVKKKNNEK